MYQNYNPYSMPYGMNIQNMYAQRLNSLEQQAQPIQQVNGQAQATCYFVNSSNDLNNISMLPNTVYIGFNAGAKEIYTRRINNDGIIESETYIKSAGTQEKSEMQIIIDKLNFITEKMEKNHEYDITKSAAASSTETTAE